MAVNSIAKTVDAAIEDSTVDATGTVSVTASADIKIDVLALGISGTGAGGGVGGVSVGVGGSVERSTRSPNSVQARITDATVRTTSTVSVTATDRLEDHLRRGGVGLAGAGGGTGGVAVAVGVTIAENRIGNITVNGTTHQQVTRAVIEGSTIGSAGARAAR